MFGEAAAAIVAAAQKQNAAACADILNFVFAVAAPSILLKNCEVRAILP
jgi:hypothetical protein